MSSRITAGFLSILTGKFGVIGLGLIITPLLVRILGSENYGDYAFLLSIFTVVTTICHAGISAGIRKFIAEDGHGDYWAERVFAFYTWLGIGIAVLSSAIIVGVGWLGPVEQFFGAGFSVYFLLLAAMILTDQFFYIFRYTLMGLHYERYSEPLSVLKKALLGVFGLSLAYIGFDIAGVLAGTALASLVCAICAFWVLRKQLDMGSLFRSLPTNFPMRNLVGFNILNTVFVLLTISLYNVDILLLQPLAGSEQTGLYKAALIVAEFLWLVPQAIQIVFIHSSSEMWSKDKYDEISDMASRSTRYTLVFTILLVFGIAALASDFVQIYFGAEFSGAVVPLLLLLPGVLGFAIARPIYAIGQGKGDFRPLIIATGVASIINLILNLILIPLYGISGAAIATSIGYGSMVVFHGFAAQKIGYSPFADLRLYRVALTAVLSAPFIFGTAFLIESGILSLVVVPPIGFIVYMTFSIRLRAISPEEITPVLKDIPHPVNKISVKAVKIIG